jgi:two-component system LytT family response regulator
MQPMPSNILTAIIVEDNTHAREDLEQLLGKHFPQVQLLASVGTITEGIHQLSIQEPDLLLLDIELPDGTGFDLLSAIDHGSVGIIFTTAFDHYTLQALRFSALDYLLKPVQTHELAAALQKAVARKEQAYLQRQMKEQLDNLWQLVNNKDKEQHRLALPLTNEVRLLYTRDIVRCEGKGAYTHFHIKDGDKVVVSYGLAQYKQLLEEYGFIQPNQSALVNMAYIKSLCNKDYTYDLLLIDGSTKVHVSRLCVDMVKDRIYQHKHR